MRFANEIRRDHQIVENELRRLRAVGQDAADASGRDQYNVGPMAGHPRSDLLGVP
jgi:hypothetical protein